MVRHLDPGVQIHAPSGAVYCLERELEHPGSASWLYEASSTARPGERLFLKLYFTPGRGLSWFRDWCECQDELWRRIENDPDLSRMVLPKVELFVAPTSPSGRASSEGHFQVFEWMDGGKDLDDAISDIRTGGGGVDWQCRLIWARVLMSAISKLHAARIVHCDLKPQNVRLVEVGDNLALKLMDFDASILSDCQAPFHDDPNYGYFGTMPYMSPEHCLPVGESPELRASRKPLLVSDVYTCGLMLYELLATGHPYPFDTDTEAYWKAALGHEAKAPELQGRMPGGNDAEVTALIHRMLSPDHRLRPSAQEAFDALAAPAAEAKARPLPTRAEKRRAPAEPPGIRPRPPKTPAKGSVEAVATAQGQKAKKTRSPRKVIVLESGGNRMRIGVSTKLNRRSVRALAGEEGAVFWDSSDQMKLELRSGTWYVVPNMAAKNETMLNGKAVESAVAVTDDDVIGVGSSKHGIVKTPLRVRIEVEPV